MAAVADSLPVVGGQSVFFNSDDVIRNTMNEMVVDLGPEKFAQLWRDPRPVPVAFADIAGQPMNRWLHDYLDYAVGDRHDGTRVDAASLTRTLLVLVLAGALGAMVARGWRAGA